MTLIKVIRNIRAENKVMPNKTVKLKIYASPSNVPFIETNKKIIDGLVKSEETILVDAKLEDNTLAFGVVKSGLEVYVDTANAMDVEKEVARLKEQINDTKTYINILDKKLLNEQFVSNAPEKLVRAEMEKKEQAKEKLFKLEDKLVSLLK